MAGTSKYRTNLSKDEAPQHMVMPYVLRGYCEGGDYRRCLLAAFEMHTETLNAWTMVANAVICIAMFLWVAAATYPPAPALLPFAALTAAVLIHMPFSVGYHLFCCMSAEVSNLWLRLDQMFQFVSSVLITFALSWHAYNSWVGLAINTCVAAALAVQGVRAVRCVKPHHKYDRLQFVLLIRGIALSIASPVVYCLATGLAATGKVTAAGAYGLAACALNRVGAWIFAKSFPEKHFPGVFDLVGHSHQLMHAVCTGVFLCLYMFLWELHKESVHVVM